MKLYSRCYKLMNDNSTFLLNRDNFLKWRDERVLGDFDHVGNFFAKWENRRQNQADYELQWRFFNKPFIFKK